MKSIRFSAIRPAVRLQLFCIHSARAWFGGRVGRPVVIWLTPAGHPLQEAKQRALATVVVRITEASSQDY